MTQVRNSTPSIYTRKLKTYFQNRKKKEKTTFNTWFWMFLKVLKSFNTWCSRKEFGRTRKFSYVLLGMVWVCGGVCMYVCAQSCSTPCDRMDCSPPASSVHGIFQVRILEWVAISCSRGSSQPRDQTHVSCISCISRQILYHCTIQEA